MKAKSARQHDGKSLKTVLIYITVVFVLIAASLAWKAFTIFQQSKFTGEHFTLALAQNDKVKEVIVINPADESLSVLKITDNGLKLSDLTRRAAIAPDALINIKDNADNIIKEDVSETLTGLGFRYPTLDTNTTIFDIVRLNLYAKNLPPNKKTLKEASTEQLTDDTEIEKSLVAFLSDNVIATENVSIQIINASGISGMAQRLERILLHKGANVVTVSTAPKSELTSKITYYGQETYTLQKMQKLLGFTLGKIENETIADIIITLGEDSKNTTVF